MKQLATAASALTFSFELSYTVQQQVAISGQLTAESVQTASLKDSLVEPVAIKRVRPGSIANSELEFVLQD